jgi:hypothetical protein
MELFIVIVIIGLAAAYILKTFYNKYKIGKAGGSSCGCTSCDLNDTDCGQMAGPKSDNYLS